MREIVIDWGKDVHTDDEIVRPDDDYREFFKASNAADLAIVGILGDDLDAGEIEAVCDALTKLTDARHIINKVYAARRAMF